MFGLLRATAREADLWDVERSTARSALARHNPEDLIGACLLDDDADGAWAAVDALPAPPHPTTLTRLVRETAQPHPQRVYDAYPVLVEASIAGAERTAYRQACRLLREMGRVAERLGCADGHGLYVKALAGERCRSQRGTTCSASSTNRHSALTARSCSGV